MSNIPAGYQQTDIGVIPSDWEVKTLFELCLKIQDGTHFSPKIGGSDFLYLTSKNVRFGFLDISNADSIDKIQHQNIYKRCDVKYGDLLLTKDGANTGNAAINIIKEEFSLLSSVAFLRFDSDKHNANYFLQHILSSSGQSQIKEAMSGNAITRLTLQKIKKLFFPFPPTKAEQTAISTALSDADMYISSLEKLIAKKQAIKQGAMQQLLTPKADWVVKKVSDLCEVGRGRVISHREINSSMNYAYPVYSSQTTNDGIMGYIDTYDFDGEYITWTTDGEKAGTVFYRNGKFNCTNVCGTLKLRKGNAKYFAVALNQIATKHVSRNLANPKLMNDAMKKIEIALPDPEEQTRIATILSDMDADIAATQKQLAKARSIKQGMMQQLLTGKIRLI